VGTFPQTARETGAAYQFDVTTGQEIRKLVASDADAGDLFGYSVAVSGNVALVGAPEAEDDDHRIGSGAAYLFDVTTGQQLRKLVAADAAAGDFFGYSVAISGDIALVGAPEHVDAASSSGSAYLFNVATGQQLAKLTASDAAMEDRFGHSVALSGDMALVGAFFNDAEGSNAGAAYLFDVTTAAQIIKLTPSDAAAGDWFGESVALSSDLALVGAKLHNNAGTNSGSAYLFSAAADGLPGDFNRDGTVDTADYVVWRKGFGTVYNQNHFNMWRSNFGQTSPSGAGESTASHAVPEPAGIALACFAVLLHGRRRKITSVAETFERSSGEYVGRQ
jgi:hypothetical protein